MSSHFDLVDFRLFANIAEAASFTAGAGKSNLSTSAASLRIRNLEQSLGARLFLRTSQGSSLTSAGEAALDRIRAILRDFDELKEVIAGHSDASERKLRISVSNSGVEEPLSTVIREYRRRYPNVELSLHAATSNEIVPLVASGDVDIGIGGSSRSGQVVTLPYLQDRLVLITAPDHPLTRAKAIRFADALDYEIIGLPEFSGVQLFMRRIEQTSRKTMRISMTVSSNEALRQMVESGLGVGVISERVASRYCATLPIHAIALKDKAAATDINVHVSNQRELPGHAAAFVDLLQTHANAAVDAPRAID